MNNSAKMKKELRFSLFFLFVLRQMGGFIYNLRSLRDFFPGIYQSERMSSLDKGKLILTHFVLTLDDDGGGVFCCCHKSTL